MNRNIFSLKRIVVSMGCVIVVTLLIYAIHDRVASTTTTSEEYRSKNDTLYPSRSRGSTIYVDETGQVRIPPQDVLDQLTLTDLEELYNRYMESIQTICRNQIRFGKVVDGGYFVCLDQHARPSSDCLAYSFGIRRDYDFETQLSDTCGCEVHCFDPGDGQKSHQHAQKIFFHKIGIAGKDATIEPFKGQRWKVRTVSSIKKKLHHKQRPLEVLKIDTEGAEWGALSQMLSDGTLKEVKQLNVEFHVHLAGSFSDRNTEAYKHHLLVLRALYNEGFRIYYFRSFFASLCLYKSKNGTPRTGCHEIHFMKL